MRVVECEQGSDLWLKAREGKITASRMADVLSFKQPSAAQAKAAGHALVREAVAAGIKGDESEARSGYRIEVMAERLSGRAVDRFVTLAMKWGIEKEPEARSRYQLLTMDGAALDRPGFVLHPTLDYAGASPDGLCGRHGGAEFKCPETTTHLEYMLAGVVPEAYIPQMDMEMLCCERDWIDFVSYDPRMIDEDLQLFIVRHNRDEAKLKEMEAEIVRFEGEIQAQIDALRRVYKANKEKGVYE